MRGCQVRPPRVLQAVARPVQRPTLRFHQQRCKHTVPNLGHLNTKGSYFSDNGVPGLFTPKTYKQAWLQYQQHLCDEVNATQEGLQRFANLTPLQLHEQCAHAPAYASLYNWAAMLHFNHFYWESLSTEHKSVPASSQLLQQINKDFGSPEELRIEMLQHGDAMFGNGFVWLVRQSPPSIGMNEAAKGLRILCTYNAGSPYPKAHVRRQDRDMSSADTRAEAQSLSARSLSQLREVQNRPGAGVVGTGSRWPNALDAEPILCLNVWQHIYLTDYGILGKQTYLAAWWERIDWDVVSNRFIGAAQLDPGSASDILKR